MRFPDLQGVAGKAWNMGKRGEYDVVTWYMLVPGAHPLWNWYVVSVVHLRGTVGEEPPVLQYPEAEHELIIFAIVPKHDPDPDAPVTAPMHYLTPVNLSVQFHGVGDEGAAKLGAGLVLCFVTGQENPDDDHRSRNEAVVRETAAHLRGEHVH